MVESPWGVWVVRVLAALGALCGLWVPLPATLPQRASASRRHRPAIWRALQNTVCSMSFPCHLAFSGLLLSRLAHTARWIVVESALAGSRAEREGVLTASELWSEHGGQEVEHAAVSTDVGRDHPALAIVVWRREAVVGELAPPPVPGTTADGRPCPPGTLGRQWNR